MKTEPYSNVFNSFIASLVMIPLALSSTVAAPGNGLQASVLVYPMQSKSGPRAQSISESKDFQEESFVRSNHDLDPMQISPKVATDNRIPPDSEMRVQSVSDTLGDDTWTSHGPYGGQVLAIAIDPLTPTTLYAKSDEISGLFKSTNAGANWTAVNTGLTDYHFSALVIDPLTPNTVYVGTNFGGVFKTTDGGSNWGTANVGLSNTNIYALAIDPRSPNTLYAGTHGGGVFRSTDGGSVWTAASTGLTNSDIGTLAIDPATPTTIYAGGYYGGGVYKSTDGGNSWNTILASTSWVYALVVDPRTPTILYVVDGQVRKSIDSGGHWTTLSTGMAGTIVKVLAIDPLTPSTLYLGGDYVGGIPVGPGVGVFKSTNGGQTWGAANAGLTNAGLTNVDISALAINPVTPATLYVGTRGGGVFKSTDGGSSWHASNSGFAADHVRALAIDPVNHATVYATTNQAGTFRSFDGGRNWTAINNGLTNGVYALLIDPSRPSTVYGVTPSGLYRSSNGGSDWTLITTGLAGKSVTALAIDPVTPSTLYAVGRGVSGVSKSINGGVNWIAANTGLTNTDIYALAVDPLAPLTLYAGSWKGVFKSIDGGTSWIYSGLTLPVFALAIDPMSPSTVYAAGWARTVFKSTDGGVNWVAANTGITDPGPVERDVVALAIYAAAPSTLYAGSRGGGVFRSTNGGRNWTDLNIGLANTDVLALAIDPVTPTTLYAGTSGGTFSIQQVAISAYSISGVVRDMSNNPISGVNVSASASGIDAANIGYSATTNANGYFLVSGLMHGGSYRLTPVKSGLLFSPLSSLITNLTSNRTGVNFTGLLACPALFVSVNPPSVGSVAASTSPNCNAGSGYAAGTSVALTATASSGYRFVGWSGAATGTSKVVNLVMDGNKSLTANFGPAQSAQKPPIMFVHGWHGLSLFAETSCSTGVQHFPDQTDRSDFGPIPSWLTQTFDVWIAHLSTSAFNTPSLDENGACLRDQIDFVYSSTQGSKVILVAHSMGGLVSRAAIEGNPMDYDKVTRLVTLGSPHLGVPMNNFLIAALCNAGDLGACEFSELGMAQIFNPGHPIRNDEAEYYVIGGHESNFRPRFDGGSGDGIISQRSATFLPGSAVTAYRTNESHTTDFGYPTYMEAAYGATNVVNAGVTFRCVISPTVYGRPRPQDCNAGELMQPAADEVPPLSQTPLISGSVGTGQVVSHAVWVESSGSSVFNLSWITGTLDFTLTSPVGQVITPGYAQANPALAQFNSIPISSPFGALTSYGFMATTSGLWTLLVGNSGLISPVGYRLQVDFESPLAMTTSLNNNVYPGGSTIVLTTAIGVGPAISNVQASVLFLWPDGATSAVTATAVDSNTLVAQTVVPPTSAGYAMAQVSVSGYVNGAPFEQGSHAEFLVPASGAKLAGAYAEHAVDESATGLFNALNWEAGISVTAPATYTLSADLMGAGQVIAHAQSQGFLAPGMPTLTVRFSGDAIRASQMDGPYTVTNVLLIDSSSYGLLADSASAVWTTGAYGWKGFAATCYVLTLAPNAGGTVSANPAPDCNNGLQYAAGTVVRVTATANAGYLFSHWSDDASGASNSVTVTLSADRAPTANFTRWPHEAFLPILLR